MRSNACRRRISRCRRRSAAATLTSPPSCGSCPRCAYTWRWGAWPTMRSSWRAGSRAGVTCSHTDANTCSMERNACSIRIIAAATTPRPDGSPRRCSQLSWRGPASSPAWPCPRRCRLLRKPPAVFDPKEFIASLPRRPGVYRMFGAARELLYVGKARSLKDRVGTYFAAGNVHPKVQALTAQIDAIEVTVTNSETEALLLEYNLIKAHKPRFNVVLRDDKSFPYIQLCVEHEFPRLIFYRGARSGARLVRHAVLRQRRGSRAGAARHPARRGGIAGGAAQQPHRTRGGGAASAARPVRGARPARAARAHGVLRYQPHGRRGHGGILRRVRSGGSSEERVPALQHQRRDGGG